jgi:hypothetical protein
MNKKVLIKRVKEEAKILKRVSSDEEKSKLNIDRLSAFNTLFCVYGLMTGHCYSDRAIKLKLLCNKTGYVGGRLKRICKKRVDYFTPIEEFLKINHTSGMSINNEILINYLKNNTTKLNFKSNEKVSRSY